MAKTHSLSRQRGNGAYAPTLAGLSDRMAAHEREDQDRHEAINKSVTSIATNVQSMAATLGTIVTEKQAETLFQKWKEKWLVYALGIGGVGVPLATTIYDHLVK